MAVSGGDEFNVICIEEAFYLGIQMTQGNII